MESSVRMLPVVRVKTACQKSNALWSTARIRLASTRWTTAALRKHAWKLAATPGTAPMLAGGTSADIPRAQPCTRAHIAHALHARNSAARLSAHSGHTRCISLVGGTARPSTRRPKWQLHGLWTLCKWQSLESCGRRANALGVGTSGCTSHSPRAASAARGAFSSVRAALGGRVSGLLRCWRVPEACGT